MAYSKLILLIALIVSLFSCAVTEKYEASMPTLSKINPFDQKKFYYKSNKEVYVSFDFDGAEIFIYPRENLLTSHSDILFIPFEKESFRSSKGQDDSVIYVRVREKNFRFLPLKSKINSFLGVQSVFKLKSIGQDLCDGRNSKWIKISNQSATQNENHLAKKDACVADGWITYKLVFRDTIPDFRESFYLDIYFDARTEREYTRKIYFHPVKIEKVTI